MSGGVEVKVPDIGDFKDIPVIEVLVKVGDTIKVDDSLVTLESDKATMDVPSSVAGVVTEIRLKVGDKVSEGTLVALVKVGAGATAALTAAPAAPSVTVETPAPAAAAIAAGSYNGKVDIETDMLVLGAGPGGYSAAFRAAD